MCLTTSFRCVLDRLFSLDVPLTMMLSGSLLFAEFAALFAEFAREPPPRTSLRLPNPPRRVAEFESLFAFADIAAVSH